VLYLGASRAPEHIQQDHRCCHEVLRRHELRRGRRDSSPSTPPSVILELRLDSGFAADTCHLCLRLLSSEGTAAATGARPAHLRVAAVWAPPPVKGSMHVAWRGMNRPAKQNQPISAKFCPDPRTSGFFPETSGKMHLGVFCWSFQEFFSLSICCG
jgi:hypothetical protein